MGLALFITASLSCGAQNSKITFKTKLPQGATITFALEGEGTPEATGLKEALISDGLPHSYTLESDEILLSGAISSLTIIQQEITTLDVRAAKELKELVCSGNLLEELNIARSKGLELLDCSSNQLTALAFPKDSSLKTLRLMGNSIQSLSLDRCPRLEELDYSHNYYPTSLETSYCPELKTLLVGGNKIQSLSLSNNKKLETLSASSNELRSIDLSMLPLLKELRLARNESLATITWGSHPSLEVLDLFSTAIASLDLSAYPELIELQCGYSKLKSLDTSHNKKLRILSCGKNNFKGIDVSSNEVLEELSCNDLSIEELDLSHNPRLTSLSAHHNAIRTIDLSRQTQLRSLNLSDNLLDRLDLSALTAVEEVVCNNNLLHSLQLPTSASLAVLKVYSNKLAHEEMKAIISRMPDRSNVRRGLLEVVDTKAPQEENDCRKQQVQTALKKNWRVVDYAGFANLGKGYDYRGSDAPLLGSGKATLSFEKSGATVSLVVETLGNLEATGTDEEVKSQKDEASYTLSGKELKLSGDLYRLKVSGATLNSVTLESCTYLRELTLKAYSPNAIDLPALEALAFLDLRENELSQIALGDMPILERFSCYGNRLSVDSGKSLIAQLPKKKEGEKGILVWINSNASETEDNQVDKSLISLAEEKGWILTDYKGGLYGEEGVPLSKETSIPTVLPSHKEHATKLYKEGTQWRVESIPSCPLYLYNLNGVQLISAVCDAQGVAYFSTTFLPRGVYLLRTPHETLKLIVE